MNLLQAVNSGELLVDEDDLRTYGNWLVLIYPDQNNYLKVQLRHPVLSNKYFALGRLILNLTDPELEADHKNLNPRDCRKDNLRVATSSQNKMNRNVRSNSKTGYKGVWRKANGLYVATITTKLGKRTIGSSYDPIVAAKLYDDEAKKYFGEFARLNFPEEPVCENSSVETMNGWSGGDSSASSQTSQE